MKKGIYILLLLVSALSYGQQGGQIELKWAANKAVPLAGGTITVPQFDGRYMGFDVDSRRLYCSVNLPVSGRVNESSLQISNVVYEALPESQLGDLSRKGIPTAINPILKAVHARNEWRMGIRLSPIIKEGTAYKRIKSFTYSYAMAAGSAERSIASTATVVNSALSSGNWFRFYVEKSGVYKLSKQFLQSLGVDTSQDPRTIKVYGNGGRMAPMLNSVYYPIDPEENAVTFIGEDDGHFDNNDYILFYAEGVDNWNADSGTNNNLFADKTYYYVTAGGSAGKRMQQMAQPTGPATITTSTFDEYQYHELDLVNIAHLGRKWHGEQFNIENKQDFDFTVPDLDTGTPVSITVSAAAASAAASSMSVKANGSDLVTLNFSPQGDEAYAYDAIATGTFTGAANKITVSLEYNNAGVPGANAYLDYVLINARRNFKGNGRQFRFRYRAAANNTGIIEYDATNASGISAVWDITDIYNAAVVTANTAATFSFKANAGEVRQYVAVVPSDYYTPVKDNTARVANQNIKGTIFKSNTGQFQDIDYIIITPQSLSTSAETLANLHRTMEGMVVKVVTLESLYQEFSSGKQDIGALRNFIKYVYNNASSADKRLKYVNLFGDASFDYKNRIPNNSNIVPSVHRYDASNSGVGNYSKVTTFVTDDFFGLMDPAEGLLSGYEGLDVAMGRMLVNNKTQADEMVAKVQEYLNAESYGRWRNEYIMVADDLDVSGEGFVPTLEDINDYLRANKPFINVRKVYTDSYVQQASAGGFTYPDAQAEILRNINNGALVFNYLGHGGEQGMASERIFQILDAQSLTNKYKYPLFITATCELTRFDNPSFDSVGEYVYWNTNGGAIAMITTTRSIYISDAFTFNDSLSQKLFPTGDVYPTMAEALRQVKTSVTYDAQFIKCVSFIGDPALKLAVAKPNIVLTKINDVPIAQSTEVFQSLAYVKLTGKVLNETGSTMSNYNGDLEVSVFDKPTSRVTLDNDGVLVHSIPTDTTSPLIPYVVPFSTLGETIFRGNASVVNGQFEFGFVVPRDIRIPVDNGRVSFYSKRANVLEDRQGYDASIKVGGVNTSAAVDVTPPTVKLYMNDESFVSGGITNNAPILLAYLQDEHGINTSSGIGHDIIGILDGDETHPFLMNDYYEANTDNYKQGTVNYPFLNLAKGIHTLTFKAWDVYNNLVSADIQFVVAGEDGITLEHVLNYPNPFVSYTEFWFNHNRPFEPLDVQVQIFTVTGKIVRTINQQVVTDGFLSRDIKWDGRDDFGDKIGKGVYIYKLTVKSVTSNKKAEKIEKLVLL